MQSRGCRSLPETDLPWAFVLQSAGKSFVCRGLSRDQKALHPACRLGDTVPTENAGVIQTPSPLEASDFSPGLCSEPLCPSPEPVCSRAQPGLAEGRGPVGRARGSPGNCLARLMSNGALHLWSAFHLGLSERLRKHQLTLTPGRQVSLGASICGGEERGWRGRGLWQATRVGAEPSCEGPARLTAEPGSLPGPRGIWVQEAQCLPHPCGKQL